MAHSISAKQALTKAGWRHDITIDVSDDGLISAIRPYDKSAKHKVGILLPALSNVHSHSFQRAMAGLAETRGPSVRDDFWTWRQVMYRFLEILTPDDVEIIAAQVQMEMLEAGYAASGEFHYLHHAPGGGAYDTPIETSLRHFNAAAKTGIGYTHLPVLYMQGGLDGRALEGGQKRFGSEIEPFQNLYSDLQTAFQNLPKDFTLGVAPHSLRAVTQSGLEACAELSTLGPLHIHAAEQTAEVQEVVTHLSARPVEWLLENTPIDERWCLIHATHMNETETRGLAASGAVAGLCPLTEANLGDGIFNGADFLEAGGAIGIGSDSNINIALSEELRMLEVSQRLRHQRRIVLSHEDTPSNGRYLYEQAARGGAQAIGRNSGAVEVGAYADMTALDETHYAISGLKEDKVLDTWIFACGDDLVSDVWAAGRHVVSGGQHIRRAEICGAFKRTMTRLRGLL